MIVLANFFEETEEYIVTNCIVLLPASRVTVSLRVRSFLPDASKYWGNRFCDLVLFQFHSTGWYSLKTRSYRRIVVQAKVYTQIRLVFITSWTRCSKLARQKFKRVVVHETLVFQFFPFSFSLVLLLVLVSLLLLHFLTLRIKVNPTFYL